VLAPPAGLAGAAPRPAVTAPPAIAASAADPAATAVAAPPPAARSAAVPYLVESRWQLSQVQRRPCAITATAAGFGPGEMIWAGFDPGKYTVAVRAADTVLWRKDLVTDASGRLEFSIDAKALAPVTVDIGCAAAS
jgi:hypothetical protein